MKEIEEKFLINEADMIFKEFKQTVLVNILNNKEKLRTQILDVFKKLSEKSNKDDGLKIRYVDFSILKVSILNEKYEIFVAAYDKNWYAGEMIYESFCIDYVFKGLTEIRDDLYKKAKKYVGKIRCSSIDQYILKKSSEYNNYLTFFFIEYLKQYDEEESFKEMNKEKLVTVIYGDYKGNSQIVYSYDEKTKDEEEFKLKFNSGKKQNFVFEQWTNIELKDFCITNKDITCMNLKYSNINNFMLKECKSVGVNFKESTLKKCKFMLCDLGTADFSKRSLEDVVFENCILRNAKFDNAKLSNVYVKNHNKLFELKTRY